MYKTKSVFVNLNCSFSVRPRLPYDWKTPFGYLVTVVVFLSASTFGGFLGVTATVCLSIGFSWLLIAFADSIVNDVIKLNATNGKYAEMKKLLKSIVEDLSDMKQLSSHMMKIEPNRTFEFAISTWFPNSDSLAHSMQCSNSTSRVCSYGRCSRFVAHLCFRIGTS